MAPKKIKMENICWKSPQNTNQRSEYPNLALNMKFFKYHPKGVFSNGQSPLNCVEKLENRVLSKWMHKIKLSHISAMVVSFY